MKIYPYNPSFGTNARSYYLRNDKKDYRATVTYMFRDDFHWKKFTNYLVDHFKNKDKVNFIQFASSDGSEAYTQLMCFSEHKDVKKFYPIMAYDIDEEVVKAANSGYINLNNTDKDEIKSHSFKFKQYFSETNAEYLLDNDGMDKIHNPVPSSSNRDMVTKTYKVSKNLTDKVKFHHADMYDILLRHQDEANTVIMCRNILGYFTEKQVDFFLELAGRKLKKGSIMAIGDLDKKKHLNINLIFQHKGFVPIMENVFRKAF